MDKKLLEYLAGDCNVTTANVIISREITPTGMQYIHISCGDRVIYEFWSNPNKSDKKPKHTGGKKPYVMLMVDEVEKLKLDGVKNIEELIGCLACLGKYVEWSTGRVIHKRTKKPFKYKDLQSMFSFGKRKLDQVLKQLKEYDLLVNTQEGYFISNRIIKKGNSKN